MSDHIALPQDSASRASAVAAGAAWIAAILMVGAPVLNFFAVLLFGRGFAEASMFSQHLGVVLAFAGAVMASASRSHLALGARSREIKGGHGLREGFVLTSSVAVETIWAISGLSLALLGFGDEKVGFLRVSHLAWAFPIGFLGMAVADLAASPLPFPGRLLSAVAGMGSGLILAGGSAANVAYAFGSSAAFLEGWAALSSVVATWAAWPLALALVAAGLLGAPLFVVMAGLAAALFVKDGMVVELAASESWSMLRSANVAAIPVFTLTGFLLAASRSGDRLVTLFRSAFHRMPGGSVVAAVVVCAFFSTFTGSNGVAILALGPVLAFAISKGEGMAEDKAQGLVTASGSIGLLFPPSLAVIVYGVTAQFVYGPGRAIDLMDFFRGGLIPGLLFVLATIATGLVPLWGRGKQPREEPATKTGRAMLDAIPELALPLLIALLFFTGSAGVFEIGALSVTWVLAWGFIRKEYSLAGLLAAGRRAFPVIGGTLVLLAAARGLSYFIIDAGIPSLVTGFVTTWITSRHVFLLALTLVLLAAGCVMDVFSAVLVLAPLVIPAADLYGIHPVHLSAIFISNLAVGFLTPPVGMNLFLGSYAFGRPLWSVWRSARRFFLVQLAIALAVAYLPFLSLSFVK
ncbi:MAG: TRAP transporter large permease subunit [Spirochaetales bacterium]|nr:TRAP transporter large permease subunit [Spirochaetales bacterium]